VITKAQEKAAKPLFKSVLLLFGPPFRYCLLFVIRQQECDKNHLKQMHFCG